MIKRISISVVDASQNDSEKIILNGNSVNQSEQGQVAILKYLLSSFSGFSIEVDLKVKIEGQDKSLLEISSKLKSYNDKLSGENTAQSEILTRREKEILGLILKGYTNKEMAEQLFISSETVKSHRKNILEKTGVRNSASLANFMANQIF
ncbi:MAG: helix-turn-helix transcriptional regulator [Bacteroidetes bacterium]|nr:helix-turn-helix transcriptional regulator [Bacteroidota bacterium]